METLFQPIYAHLPPKLSWQADEAVLELDQRPHLLARVEIRGRHFAERDAQPFVRLADRHGGGVLSWFAEIDEEGACLNGYFAVDALNETAVVEYGYGNQVLGRLEGIEPLRLDRLDRTRLPKDLVVVTEEVIERTRRKAGGSTPKKHTGV